MISSVLRLIGAACLSAVFLSSAAAAQMDAPARAQRLMGILVAAYPDFLAGFESHLSEAGVGTISEVFDAEAPYYPRGCIAQAWSVAEVLRCRARIGCPPPST